MLIVLEGLLVDLKVGRALPEFVINLPFVDHLIRGRIQPAELKIQIGAVLIENHVHLDFFDGNEHPRVILTAGYLEHLCYLRALEAFHLCTEGFSGVIEMSLGETTAHYGIVLLAGTSEGFQVDD